MGTANALHAIRHGVRPVGLRRHGSGVRNANAREIPAARVMRAIRNAQKILAKRERASGNGGFVWDCGIIGDVSAFVFTTVPSRGLILGDWSSIALLPWNTLQVGANVTLFFAAGIVGIRALWSCDALVKYH